MYIYINIYILNHNNQKSQFSILSNITIWLSMNLIEIELIQFEDKLLKNEIINNIENIDQNLNEK